MSIRSATRPRVTPAPSVRLARREVVSLAALWVFLFVVLASAGCAVKFIGDYDQTIDNGVTDVQQRAELYFGKLRSEPQTPYDPASTTTLMRAWWC